MLSHAYNIIIDHAIGSTGIGKYVDNDLYSIENIYTKLNGQITITWVKGL